MTVPIDNKAPDIKLSIDRLTEFLGAEATGLALSQPLDGKTFREIRKAFTEHQLLVFRNQTLTPAQQIAFSQNFGELERFPTHSSQPDYPEIFPVSNRSETGYVNVGHYWHHDGSFLVTPTSTSLFYFIQADQQTGDFLFTNMYTAYETLPEDLKQQVEGLQTVHGNGVVHSLVRTHPVTGRKVLYINMGLTVGIIGLSRQEAIWLMRDLNRHLNRPAFVYHHKPQVGDLIVCDNASVAHFATYADKKYPQTQHRTTVQGTLTF